MKLQEVSQVLLTLIITTGQFCYSQVCAAQGAMWSKEATYLSYKERIRQIQVVAPDHGKAITVNNDKLDIISDGRLLFSVYVDTLAEVAWSPDSRAFFITESRGGNVGTFIVSVYTVENGIIRYFDVMQKAISEFKKHYMCYVPEVPNIGAVKWLGGSDKLLLMSEVPPHSGCPEMGKVRGYIVEVPSGRIVEEFDERTLASVVSQQYLYNTNLLCYSWCYVETN